VRDADGRLTEVHAELVPDTKSGTPGADLVKVKGVITWVGAHDAVPAEVRLYERLFSDPHPDAGGKNFLEGLNPDSLRTVQAYLEPSMEAEKEQAREAKWVERNQARKISQQLRERYEGLTKAERADHLAERGLSKTGNVDERVERLLTADSN
jgi:hypothetical protein